MTTKHGVLLVLVCNLMVSMNCQDSPNLDGKMLNVTFELFLEPTTTQPPPTTTQTVPTTEPTVPTTEPTVPTTAAPTEPTTEPTTSGLTPPTTTRASSGPTIPSSTQPTTKTMTASTDGGMTASTDLGMTMSTDEGLTMSTDGGLTMSTDGGMTASTDGALTMTTDGVTNMTTEGVMNMSTGQTTAMGTSQSTGMDSNERTSMSTGQATLTSTGPPTSSSTDPATSSSTDPATSSSTDPATSSSTDPATSSSTDPATAMSTDPATSSSTDPATTMSTEQAGDIPPRMMNDVEVRAVTIETTTQEEVTLLPPSTLGQIQAFLWEAFNETTGFMDIDMGGVTPAAMQAALQANNLGIQYRVILNAKTLSDTGALSQAGLVKELEDARTNIVDSSEDFQGYQVDAPATTTSMNNTIAEVSNNLQSACDQLGPVCSNSNTTCYVNGTISCPSNCVLFMDAHPQCANADDTLTTIFPKGLCTLDIHGYPYCDCGMSPGDIMDNFLFNDGCLSSAFVVGIAAGIGGGLILIFMFATIGLAVRKRKQKESKPAVHYNGFNDVTLERAKPVVIIPEDYEPRDHSDRSSRVSAVKETAFSNKGYETFKPDEDHDAEGDLHSYDLLQAQYQHIDPKADYSIKRPTLIQPTNHYDSDDIIIRL